MEKENKRSRETAKKEYSDNVRALAKLLQKRDPRWKIISEGMRHLWVIGLMRRD